MGSRNGGPSFSWYLKGSPKGNPPLLERPLCCDTASPKVPPPGDAQGRRTGKASSAARALSKELEGQSCWCSGNEGMTPFNHPLCFFFFLKGILRFIPSFTAEHQQVMWLWLWDPGNPSQLACQLVRATNLLTDQTRHVRGCLSRMLQSIGTSRPTQPINPHTGCSHIHGGT